MATPRSLIELRVLDGPNRFLRGPAIQLRLDIRKLRDAQVSELAEWLAEAGVAAEDVTADADDPVRAWLHAVTRHLAEIGGVDRLNVIVADGFEPDELMVVFPWSRERRATKLGEWIGWAVDDAGNISLAETFAEAIDRLRNVPPGPRPTVPRPHVPTVGITGTNGKTTTTRLLAHLLMSAGRTPAWNSTDGVYSTAADRLGGVLEEPGDWAGFNGAARVLATDGIDCAVIEVARGGILRRGLGVARLDVGIVTNVTADHLGEMGITSIDGLASVKATVIRAVAEDGWAVLNAEDARVAAMADLCAGSVCWTSLDPDALPSADGGQRRVAMTIVDGVVVRVEGGVTTSIAAVVDIPLTMNGLATHNIANVLSAAAGAIAMGLTPEQVGVGLRSFSGDADANPGRLNLYRGDDVLIVADVAHNVESMDVLVTIARELASTGAASAGTPSSGTPSAGAEAAGRLIVVAGSLGDRTADIIMGMGMSAAEHADVLILTEKRAFLRGSDPTHVMALLEAGAAKAGWTKPVPVLPDEIEGLDAALEVAQRGDVIAFVVHEHRPTLADELADRGFVPASL